MLVLLMALAPLATPALAQETPDEPTTQDDSAPPDMGAPADQAPADTSAPATDQSTPGPTATALPAATATPATATTGQILMADDFHDAAAGILPKSAATAGNGSIVPPDSFSLGYVGGAYEYKKLQLGQNASALAQLPSTYSNVSIDVDTQFTASNANTFLWITCRVQNPPGGETGYRANVRPDDSTFNIYRFDNGKPFFLVGNSFSDKLVRSPGTNHLQLTCAGDSISLAINGTVVRTIQDATYATGIIRIGTGAPGNSPDTLLLKNLVVTQR